MVRNKHNKRVILLLTNIIEVKMQITGEKKNET